MKGKVTEKLRGARRAAGNLLKGKEKQREICERQKVAEKIARSRKSRRAFVKGGEK